MVFQKKLVLSLVIVSVFVAIVNIVPATAVNKVMEPEKEGEIFDRHMDVGLDHFSKGRYQEALGELLLADKIICLAFTKYWIGQAYLKLKLPNEAEKFFDQAIANFNKEDYLMRPFYALACGEKGQMLYAREEYMLALVYFELAFINCEDEVQKSIFADRKIELYKLLGVHSDKPQKDTAKEKGGKEKK